MPCWIDEHNISSSDIDDSYSNFIFAGRNEGYTEGAVTHQYDTESKPLLTPESSGMIPRVFYRFTTETGQPVILRVVMIGDDYGSNDDTPYLGILPLVELYADTQDHGDAKILLSRDLIRDVNQFYPTKSEIGRTLSYNDFDHACEVIGSVIYPYSVKFNLREREFEMHAQRILSDMRDKHWANLTALDERIKLVAPRVTVRAEISGTCTASMYEHAPDCGVYYTSGSMDFTMDGENLADAKAVALDHFKSLYQTYLDCAPSEDNNFIEEAGLFYPRHITLYDQYRDVVTTYSDGVWADEYPEALPKPEEFEALTEEANELKAQAAIESGWDNFSTAEDLRKQAKAILNQIATAKAASHA